MAIFITIVHVFVAFFMVLVVLLQSGRGGGMGAAFGGASGQIFGGRGAAPFLAKVTTGAAVVFFLTSMSLSAISSRHRSVLLGRDEPAAHSSVTDKAADANSPIAADGGVQDAGSDAMKAESLDANATPASATP